jgi:hypothetical protein
MREDELLEYLGMYAFVCEGICYVDLAVYNCRI